MNYKFSVIFGCRILILFVELKIKNGTFLQDVDHIGMEEEEEEETEENLSKDFEENIIFVEQNQQKVTQCTSTINFSALNSGPNTSHLNTGNIFLFERCLLGPCIITILIFKKRPTLNGFKL